MSNSASAPPASPSAEPASWLASLSLRFQLMLGVNVILALLLTLALFADYRRELAHHLRHEKASLLTEAETIAAALPALEEINERSIQRLLDSILAGMNSTNAPRHRLLVEWRDQSIESRMSGRDPGERDQFQQAVLTWKSKASGQQDWETKDFAIAKCSAPDFVVYVGEPLESIQREIGYETLERLIALVVAGLIAMGVVDFILLRALVRPMENLAKTVEAIGDGRLGAQVAQYRTAELSLLGQSINRMSQMLAANDREVQQQMSKARRLQRHLLPQWPSIPGLIAERRFLPATEVTGDYHEAFPLSNGEWLFCIADVTGHGIPAAMTAAMLKVLFHQAVTLTCDPQQILAHLNSNFGAVVMPGDFATMLVVHWQPHHNQACFANAGHEPGVLLRKSGEVVLMESDGMMVGAVPEAKWARHTLPVFPGDRLLMYTDGAVEVFNSKRELFGRKRLHDAFVQSYSSSVSDAIVYLTQCLDDFRGDRPFSDDVTLLLLEFTAETDTVTA